MRSALAPLLRRSKALAPDGISDTSSPVAYTRQRASSIFPYLGGGGTAAQLRTYSTVPAVYASVSELAEATGQVEWHLWRKAASGVDEDRTEVVEHAAIDLWEQPNPFMDRGFLIEFTQLHLDLAGEAFIVIGTDARTGRMPMGLWPVVPTMMAPVPHPTKFLAGYIYTDPDGEKVPFEIDEVIHLKYPNPLDPYRGLSPVAALMPDLDADRFATEWNRNFFLNSAEPGGIIEVEESITDEEFDELRARWHAQHQGTGNAHRVAILTNGMKWVDRSFSMRDLQFNEGRANSDARIMLGFKIGKTLLGQTEGVNRATAEAAEYVFGKYRTTRRLNRYRRMWNRVLLPRFVGGDTLEWDYESPITANVEEEAKDRDSRVTNAVALINAGFERDEVLRVMGLPELSVAAPTPAPARELPPGPVEEQDDDEEPSDDDVDEQALNAMLLRAPTGRHNGVRWPVRRRNAVDPPAELDPEELPDVTRLQETFDEVMEQLIEDVAEAEGDQKDELVDQVLDIAENGSLADLSTLTVDTAAIAGLLAAAMLVVGDDAAEAVVDEAAEQGVTVTPREADERQVRDVASVVATMLGSRLISGAAAAAMRANSRVATAREVADAVRDHLSELSPDTPRPVLGAALTGTQNEARLATLRRAPEGALYAVEKNDSNTCGPCKAVDGKWLGNISDIDQVAELYPGGAYGGYIDCRGRERCRGTITGVWRK